MDSFKKEKKERERKKKRKNQNVTRRKVNGTKQEKKRNPLRFKSCLPSFFLDLWSEEKIMKEWKKRKKEKRERKKVDQI